MIAPVFYTAGLVIIQGKTWDFSLNWKDENGDLYDLRTYTGKLTFKEPGTDPADPNIYFALDTTSGLTLSNVQFNIVAAMTRAQTTALDFGFAREAFAELTLVSPDGNTDYQLLTATATLRT